MNFTEFEDWMEKEGMSKSDLLSELQKIRDMLTDLYIDSDGKLYSSAEILNARYYLSNMERLLNCNLKN